jgi:putative acetyltransferase
VCEIIEATTAQHVELVRTLFAEYLAQLECEHCALSFDAEIAGLPGDYARPRGKLLLATVVGQPVGCVGLRPFPLNGACEMKRLYVRPAFRGAKLAAVLVNRLLQEARLLGYSSVRLDSYPSTMQAAMALYRKLGFKEIDPAPLTAVVGLTYMELRLDSAASP